MAAKCAANNGLPAVLYPEVLQSLESSFSSSVWGGAKQTKAAKAALEALRMHDTDRLALAQTPLPRRYGGSRWRLAFTTSSGPSSGRIGPLRGAVMQEFANCLEAPGGPGGAGAGGAEGSGGTGDSLEFVNRVQLGGGAVEISLQARAQQSRQGPSEAPRIDLDFTETIVRVLGVEVSRRATPGRGFWKVIYETPSVRVFGTNADSVFVLVRV